MIEKIRLADLTSQEAREALNAEAVVLLPMGSLEDQGIHAPMGDYMAADLVAVEIARAARGFGIATFVAPVIPFGVHDNFGFGHGGISISHATLASLVDDMFACLTRHGICKIMVINGHGGNVPAIAEVALRWRQTVGLFVPSMYVWQAAFGVLPNLIGKEKAAQSLGHGGDPLTSVGLHFYPHLLRKDLIRPASSRGQVKCMDVSTISTLRYDGVDIHAPIMAQEVTTTGAFACDPSLSCADTGERLVARLAQIGAGLIRDHVARGLHD
ncbi:creatinine amidohydrolase [Pseudorhodobacter antarcticus]|uniref:Creatinine amidohydrolase n=1 Tax=Pseudorhodobacter antarcticus TaxID=1077947 RepID=A0A1H8KS30_9RHOB|nr:creatininase family protein [Pseudorhodobacter antarcticus]SEN95675.1 creatinine amidohydrolase [Pseudorhodobacter antarcticus]